MKTATCLGMDNLPLLNIGVTFLSIGSLGGWCQEGDGASRGERPRMTEESIHLRRQATVKGPLSRLSTNVHHSR